MTKQGLTPAEQKTFSPIHACKDFIGYRIVPELLRLRDLHANVANAADIATGMVAAHEFCEKWDKLVEDLYNLKKYNPTFIMQFTCPQFPETNNNNESQRLWPKGH
jgi:hypothetical protein